MRNRIGLALLLGTLALSPGLALAEDAPPSLEQLVVEMADTPADHAALAKYYRGRAAEARAAATRHDGMGRAYGGGKLMQRMQGQEHCKRLSAENTTIAQEYEALAKLHEEEAKKAK